MVAIAEAAETNVTTLYHSISIGVPEAQIVEGLYVHDTVNRTELIHIILYSCDGYVLKSYIVDDKSLMSIQSPADLHDFLMAFVVRPIILREILPSSLRIDPAFN
jgi:hypothetical protein